MLQRVTLTLLQPHPQTCNPMLSLAWRVSRTLGILRWGYLHNSSSQSNQSISYGVHELYGLLSQSTLCTSCYKRGEIARGGKCVTEAGRMSTPFAVRPSALCLIWTLFVGIWLSDTGMRTRRVLVCPSARSLHAHHSFKRSHNGTKAMDTGWKFDLVVA